ncbi:PadR family transcriptional regulator [Streptomyces silvisoli]|uniref:PadR family transcriptional regulator n=1 Tax=Streptomyces silvisoli TaxID=3034235 RepID=A0ABT5ZDW9_9ACTN|nr:PadR family transcriptional regulator [Streptomyces silvisoli]MDF3288034.1 PadR family transcriptional regulator [Streptomyces silvisoli]
MSLRHAVLGLLVGKPASGYDLMKLFNSSLANVWPATQSQVYGELARLADNGLIDVAAEGPRGRKEYTLTEEGLAELRRWLMDAQPEAQRSAALLRVFFLGVLTPEQSLDHLAKLAEQAAADHARLRELQKSRDWDEGGMLTVNGRLALEYGLRLYEMREQWARWAAQQIAASDR